MQGHSRHTRILGLDPGSRLTGYGIIDLVGNQLRHVTHGTLRLANTGGRAVIPLQQRLLLIHQGLTELIEEYRPTIMSIERVFFAKNAVSALKLGQARGAAILSGAVHGLEIVEYSPSEVKAALVGHGQADKHQVARMVQLLIGKQEFKTSDASDGLALAICHAHGLVAAGKRPDLQQAARESGRVAASLHNRLPPARKKGRLSLAEALGITAEMAEGQTRIAFGKKTGLKTGLKK